MNINNVVLVGRLVKNVEIQQTSKGGSMATFTIAVNRDYKNANKEYEADFINCIAFKHSANYLNKYCNKGQLIGITGKLQINIKKDNMGNNTYFTNVVCNTVSSFNQNNNNDYNNYNANYQEIANNNQQAQQRFQNRNGYEFVDLPEINDDDLPF